MSDQTPADPYDDQRADDGADAWVVTDEVGRCDAVAVLDVVDAGSLGADLDGLLSTREA